MIPEQKHGAPSIFNGLEPRVIFYIGCLSLFILSILTSDDLIANQATVKHIAALLKGIPAIAILSPKSSFPLTLAICIGSAIFLAPITAIALLVAGIDLGFLRTPSTNRSLFAKCMGVLFMTTILAFPWVFGTLENEHLASTHLFKLIANSKFVLVIYVFAIFISNIYCWVALASMLPKRYTN